MIASFTMVLSGTIVNVAVPDVMGAFGVGQSEVQLMSTAFMIAMTTGQLLNAWLVAVVGQRWGYLGTLVLFTFGSFVASIPAPLGIGSIALEDGTLVKGFICEQYALEQAPDITHFGGWRNFLAASKPAATPITA